MMALASNPMELSDEKKLSIANDLVRESPKNIHTQLYQLPQFGQSNLR